MKKFIAVATAAACMAGSLSFPAMAASVFADINDVPWAGAEKYIEEAASLGLMAGYTENGKRLCKAKNNVTYCEAVQLIYSIMTSNDSTQKVSSSVISKWTATMAGANIPTWAYESVAYGLENSILSTNDIKIFVSSGKQNNARREDVAVIYGKALAKLYTLNSKATLTYADKDNVEATSVVYLELLNRLNLMVGDSNNKFNPKANINRAEMAVLSSKTFNKLKENTPSIPSTEQFTGTVKKVTSEGNDIVVTVDVAGTEKKATVTSSAVILKDNKNVKAADIAEGDTVVVVTSAGKATFVTILYSGNSSANSALNGTISSITTKRISINNGSKTISYNFESRYNNTVVKLDGSSSDVDALIKAIKNGDNITAKITLSSDDYVARIDATTQEGEFEGTLDSLSSSKITIKSGSKSYTYNLPSDKDDITVKIDGSSSTYDKLKDKYSSTTYNVKITLDKDKKVSRIEAKESNSAYEGTIEDMTSSRITIKSGSKTYKYSLLDDRDDIRVTIDGSSSTYDKLKNKYEDTTYTAKLTVNSKDEVTKIVATKKSSSSSSSLSGTISSISTSKIRIVNSSDKTVSYMLDDDVTVKIDGSSSRLSTLISRVDDGKNYTVKLAVNSKDEVTSITATLKETSSNSVKGTLVDANDNDGIRVRASSSTKWYQWATSGYEIMLNGSYSNIDKILDKMDSSTVTVTLTLNGAERVTKVTATSGDKTSSDDLEGTIYSLTSSKITIKTDGGSKKSYDLADSVSVRIDGSTKSLTTLKNKVNDDEKYTVRLTLNSNDEVKTIIADSEKSTRTGTIVGIDDDDIKLQIGSNTYSYELSPSVSVKINGEDAKLEELINKWILYTYEATITRNGSDLVTKIVATKK